MKQVSLPFKSLIIKLVVLTLMFFYLQGLKAQSAQELVFQNAQLESGTAGQNGAKYRFPHVTTQGQDLDAIVEIKGRSSNNVVLQTIDNTSFGWNKAFQPELGIAGYAPANSDWWMEFEMIFVKSGTTQQKSISKFDLTCLDVDGDGRAVKEYCSFKDAKSLRMGTNTLLKRINLTLESGVLAECGTCHLSSPLLMHVGCLGTGYNGNNVCEGCNGTGMAYTICQHGYEGDADLEIEGPTANFNNIDTGSTSVMGTYKFEQKDRIRFKLGARSGYTGSTAGVRMNSLWFRSFNLGSELITLPVSLTAFNAILDGRKVKLSWSTNEEVKFSHFAIERSADGRNFSDVGLVFTEGDGNERRDYAFQDNLPSNAKDLMHYRLRMVDLDGSHAYSEIKVIRLKEDDGKAVLTLFPNPVTDRVQLTLPSNWQGKEVKIELLNSGGQPMLQLRNANAGQTETIQTSNLQKGIYFIRATCGESTLMQRFLKM